MGKDNQFKDRTGEVSYTKYGTQATIVQYVNNKKVLVKFNDDYGYQYYTSYMNFKNGTLTNPYECRNKDGIGFIGVGKYNSNEHKLAYYKWSAIIQRCLKTDYSKESLKSYEDCKICDDWLNFQNFAEWFYENLYECNEPICVDKDILIHGNKIYSSDKCLLVPQRINLLFIKEKGRRGDLVIGAQHHSSGNGYISTLSTLDGNKYLGFFYNEIDAFNTYKIEKEKYIKEVADKYKDKIPDKLYKAMYRYEIKITD